MLDRAKVQALVGQYQATHRAQVEQELSNAQKIWDMIAHDPQLASVISTSTQYQVPQWQDSVGQIIPLQVCAEYTVVAIDGSQIYPDRHAGIDCFLINIGIIALSYSKSDRNSTVSFFSEPRLVMPDELEQESTVQESVNAYRAEREFEAGLVYSKANKIPSNNQITVPLVELFDGSLLFWHLKSPKTEQEYGLLARYCTLLEKFYEQRLVYGCYVSVPHSKDLIALLRAVAKKYSYNYSFTLLSDSDIAGLYLPAGHRSTLFASSVSLVNYYPAHSKPYFVYLNTGWEIARLEIPAWIAHDVTLLNQVCTIVYDQACKGYGYPLSLAEAHEQAVVTNADRDFFYHLIHQNALIEQGKNHVFSQKSSKKRYPMV